jgi:hypothetical protein
VLHSVKDNYLSKVVGKSGIGEKIYFQGATARNKALVAVFENEIKKPIIVSRYCHLTGALGAALYCIEKKIERSKFSGIKFDYKLSREICGLCSNKCDLRIYEVNGKKAAWGIKCGRDYEDKKKGKTESEPHIEKEYNLTFQKEKKKYAGE